MANLITVSEAAKKIGASVATVRRMCEQGKIPGAHHSQIKIGKGYAWLIPETSLPKIELKAEGKRSPAYGGKSKP